MGFISEEETLKMAEAGNVDAQRAVGSKYYMLRGGLTGDQNYLLAKEWYTKAANNGCAESALMLGIMHKVGGGEAFKKDLKLAAYWYNKSAENGHRNKDFMLNAAKICLQELENEK